MDKHVENKNIFEKAKDLFLNFFGLSQEPSSDSGDAPLSGMDRVVVKTPWEKYRKLVTYGGGAVVLLALILIFMPEGGRVLKVQNDRIIVAEVIEGEFDDYIPVLLQRQFCIAQIVKLFLVRLP